MKEFDRRILRDGAFVDGEDVLAEVYASRDFQAGVKAFLAHEDIEWEGR